VVLGKKTGAIKAGTIRSSAVSIRIRYGPCRYDTYSIRYTCTWLKVSKSRILDFNNKVNVLDWSIQWILQILVLKHNDHFFPQIRSSTELRSNSICLSYLLNCMKIKCETNSFGSGLFVVFCSCHRHLYRYSMMTVSIRIGWCLYRYCTGSDCIVLALRAMPLLCKIFRPWKGNQHKN